MSESPKVFEEVREFPDVEFRQIYHSLVGLDVQKERLSKEAEIIVKPDSLAVWSKKHFGKEVDIISHLMRRPPLFVFAGDVGTGKTALAKSFGAEVAQSLKMGITLFPLSLQSRGSGAVGEMTQLISSAFAEVISHSRRQKGTMNASILLIDEADAIVQSRELAQMHHEDRAGVNAVLRGIDAMGDEQLPAIIVMCTNRSDALDPAVKRRAAAIFQFDRPNEAQRKRLFTSNLGDFGISEGQIDELVELTGGDPGFTYSDFIQRLFPTIILSAFPDSGIDYDVILEAVKLTTPTPRFGELT